MARKGHRKGWNQLSSEYRDRLERGGISEEQYRAGEPLTRARGHQPREVEIEHRKQVQSYLKWGPRTELGDILTKDRYGNDQEGDRHVPGYLRRLRKLYGNKEVKRLLSDLRKNRRLHMKGKAADPSGAANWTRYSKTVATYTVRYH